MTKCSCQRSATTGFIHCDQSASIKECCDASATSHHLSHLSRCCCPLCTSLAADPSPPTVQHVSKFSIYSSPYFVHVMKLVVNLVRPSSFVRNSSYSGANELKHSDKICRLSNFLPAAELQPQLSVSMTWNYVTSRDKKYTRKTKL